MMAKRKKLPVILEPVEARRLISIPNKRYLTGLRNKAMLSVMVNIGLRVSEVANLKPSNVNLTQYKLRVLVLLSDRDPYLKGEELWKNEYLQKKNMTIQSNASIVVNHALRCMGVVKKDKIP